MGVCGNGRGSARASAHGCVTVSVSVSKNVSESVTEMDDSLRVDKYRSEYNKMLSLSKDYLQQQKLAVLFSFKDIDLKKLKKDPKQGMQQLQNLAFGAGINLFLMERGIKGIDSISL